MTPDDERRLHEAMARLEIRLDAIEHRLEDLITRWEFAPVRMVAYGLAGAMLSAVALSLVRLVLK